MKRIEEEILYLLKELHSLKEDKQYLKSEGLQKSADYIEVLRETRITNGTLRGLFLALSFLTNKTVSELKKEYREKAG